jgi:AbrB family looped-hinge helix DNA binding protein
LTSSLPEPTVGGVGKVTGKLQITLPKHIADAHGIRVGDEVAFESRGETIELIPLRTRAAQLSRAERLEQFDEATKRQRSRSRVKAGKGAGRGWTREELYDRGRPR